MDRDSGTNTMLLLIAGGAVALCVAVGAVACVFAAITLFGVNPLGPFL